MVTVELLDLGTKFKKLHMEQHNYLVSVLRNVLGEDAWWDSYNTTSHFLELQDINDRLQNSLAFMLGD